MLTKLIRWILDYPARSEVAAYNRGFEFAAGRLLQGGDPEATKLEEAADAALFEKGMNPFDVGVLDAVASYRTLRLDQAVTATL